MMRLKRYNEAEKAALERWSENCRIMKMKPTVSRDVEAADPTAALPDPFEEALGG
jgi:hypothetical protein